VYRKFYKGYSKSKAIANNKYEANSLIGKYVSACEQADHSLDSMQIGLLEKTLNEAFGIKKNKSPPADVFKELDKNILSQIGFRRHSGDGRVINILKQYREKNLGVIDDLPLSEAEAWSLYSLTAQEIEKTTYKALKEKHGLPKAYGFTSFSFLHEYFIERGIVDKESRFPRPTD